MPNVGLSRDVLAQFLPSQQAIRSFEKIQDDVNGMPATIEEVALSAALSASGTASALALIDTLAGDLDMVLAAPAVVLGTIAVQNDDDVTITGGRIDATSIGANVRAAGYFTTIAAAGQITSTVAGSAPFVVASSFEVANLRAATASALATARTIGGVSFDGTADITVATATSDFTVYGAFGCNGKTAQTAYTAGPVATDLATAITLVNNLRAALIANGIAA